MSKYLEYTRHANTGATKDSAPVLGTFLNRDKLALEALCEEIKLNGGAPMDSETLLYILSGTVDYLREQFATKCVRYRFFGITFEVACYGPFETADAKFDPAVNSLEVAVRLGEELKNCLVNETPTLVTEETASTARIYRAMDIASGALGIVIGTRSFRVTGRNVYVSREGESLKLMDGKGRIYDLVYDKIESPQRVECHLAENLQESGTCKLILTTNAGDESEEARLGIYERVVNFVKFIEPPTRRFTFENMRVTTTDGNLCIMGNVTNLEGVAGHRVDESEERPLHYVKGEVLVNGESRGEVEFHGYEPEEGGEPEFIETAEAVFDRGDTVKVVFRIDPAKTDFDQNPVEAESVAD